MESLRVRLRTTRGRHSSYREVQIPTDIEMERFAATLHAKRMPSSTTLLGWRVLYLPARSFRYSMTECDPLTDERALAVDYQTSTISWCAIGYRSEEWRVCYAWNGGDDEPPVRIQEKGDVFPVTGSPEGDLFHQSAQPIAESDGDAPLFEGAVRPVELDVYERNPEARKRCIEHYGETCFLCGFDFEAAYGRVAAGFIHVHHLRPLSTSCAEHAVDPVRDMRPLCPNCHSVVHLRTPPFSIVDVQAFLVRPSVPSPVRAASACRIAAFAQSPPEINTDPPPRP